MEDNTRRQHSSTLTQGDSLVQTKYRQSLAFSTKCVLFVQMRYNVNSERDSLNHMR